MYGGKIIKGDCMELIDKLPDNSVDLVLCDPPYGTVSGLQGVLMTDTSWDSRLDTTQLFNKLARVVRPSGKVLLFCQEPYTSHLITNTIPALPFSYRMIWEKTTAGNHLGCNVGTVNYFEDICLFTKICPKHDVTGENPLRPYFKKVYEYIGLTKKELIKQLGQRADHCFRFNSTQFTLATAELYSDLIDLYHIDKMNGYRAFEELSEVEREYRSDLINKVNTDYPTVFNLWEGNKSKSNIFKYAKDSSKLHSTQKPVLLLEDLIKTFSNEGDTVLDFCMGSGSTCVAAVNTNRRYIGYELEDKYFNIAKDRIQKREEELSCRLLRQ